MQAEDRPQQPTDSTTTREECHHHGTPLFFALCRFTLIAYLCGIQIVSAKVDSKTTRVDK
nr:MAG TPA: hypothetical protein [Caudoviricetes sp.]